MSYVGESAPPPDSPPPAEPLTRPVFGITILTVGTYLLRLIVQVATARFFGAGADLDAFIAALSLPQYLMAIIAGVLTSVCVPVIVSTAVRSGRGEARRVAEGIATLVIGGMAVVTLACGVLSGPLLRLAAPGLTPIAHTTAVHLAWLLWPMAITSAAVVLASNIDNAENRFFRAALVPVAGGLFNLVLLVALIKPLGVYGAAIATTLAGVVQMLLFASVLSPRGRRLRYAIGAPGVREAVRLFWPLLLSGVFVRITIVAERYFGSELGAGGISEIYYASAIAGMVVLLLSTGISTVFFPRIAKEAANRDFVRLANTLAIATRGMWVLTAPTLLIGICLARPLIGALFVGGKFTVASGMHVTSLLRIYFLAIAGSALGTITGRALYALQATRVVALVSAFEAVAYVGYTGLLVRGLGAAGVAWGFVIYVSLPITWHLIVIVRRARWTSFSATAWSIARTTIAAGAGAVVTYCVVALLAGEWLQLIGGGIAGVVTFAAALPLVNRADTRLLLDAIRAARGAART